MPLKHVILVLVLVGIACLVKPEWSMIFIWIGGMALLWIVTGQWLPASPRNAAPSETALKPEAEDIRPMEASMEAEDLNDLERLDGTLPPADDLDEFDDPNGAPPKKR